MLKDYTAEQMEIAIEVEKIVLDEKMNIRKKATFVKRMWEGGDYFYFDCFSDFLEAISTAEYRLLYKEA